MSKAASRDTGEKGAEIYCYMRRNGNDHEVSWNAAYAVVKRQTSGLFKTSPRHAAVMITEAVVREPNSFPNCGQYLGDLFGGKPDINESEKPIPSKTNAEERYRY